MATYSLTLIGSILERFAGRFRQHPWLGGWLIGVTALAVICTASLVIRRHDTAYVVTSGSYDTMGLLVVAWMAMCYGARVETVDGKVR